jgi:hypothetical protein
MSSDGVLAQDDDLESLKRISNRVQWEDDSRNPGWPVPGPAIKHVALALVSQTLSNATGESCGSFSNSLYSRTLP